MNNPKVPTERRIAVTVDVPISKMDAFDSMLREFQTGESKWTVASLVKQRTREKAVESLRRLLTFAEESRTGGSRVVATVLASLYNGNRFQVDLTDLRLLDDGLHADVLNVLYLDGAPEQEVHCYFDNGGERFERLFQVYGLPDRVKVATHLGHLKHFSDEALKDGLADQPTLAHRLRVTTPGDQSR